MLEHIVMHKTVEIVVNIASVRCYCGEELEFYLSTDSAGDIDISAKEHLCLQKDIPGFEGTIDALNKLKV